MPKWERRQDRMVVFLAGFLSGLLVAWIVVASAGCTLIAIKQQGEDHEAVLDVEDTEDAGLVDVHTGGAEQKSDTVQPDDKSDAEDDESGTDDDD